MFNKKNRVEESYKEDTIQVDRSLNWNIDFDTSNKTHFSPTSYNDIKEMADTFIRFREVMFDLSQVEKISERHRITDFMSGIMFALKGKFKQVDKDIYFFWMND